MINSEKLLQYSVWFLLLGNLTKGVLVRKTTILTIAPDLEAVADIHRACLPPSILESLHPHIATSAGLGG